MPTHAESQIVDKFLESSFGIGFKPGKVMAAEDQVVGDVVTFVAEKFERMRYPLGLALDFALLAQQLSLHDPQAKAFRKDLTREKLFERYKLVTERAGRGAN